MPLPEQGPPVPVGCVPLDDEDEEKNDPKADRINVVFAPSESRLDDLFPGTSWMNPDDLLPYAKKWRHTLETIAPFNQELAKKKIQYWYVPEDMTDREAPYTLFFWPYEWTPCSLTCLTKPFYCSNLSKDFPPSPTVQEVFYATKSPPFHDNVSYNTVCGVACSSHASLSDNVTYVSVAQPGVPKRYENYVWAHEGEHAQRKDRDEYFYPEGPNLPGFPNCAPNLAVADKWRKDNPHIPFLSERVGGCSYVESPTVRFTQSSLMRGGAQPEAIKLERVNEAWVSNRLQTFSGDPPREEAALRFSIGKFIAQLLGIELNPPPEEPALEVRLKRKEDDVYEITETHTTSVPNGVKPTFDDGGVVSARIGDRAFTQTFSTVGINIAERFDEAGVPALVGYGEAPVEEATVFVGLGDTRLTDDGKAILPDGSIVTIDVAVSKCSDIDENMENDCPKPMFRGEPLPTPPIEEVLHPAGEPGELGDEEQRMEQPSASPTQPLPEPPAPPSPEHIASPPPSSRLPLWLLISILALSGIGAVAWRSRKRRNQL